MRTWTHDALARDLAGHLHGVSDRMVWTDLQLGPAGETLRLSSTPVWVRQVAVALTVAQPLEVI